MGISVRFCGMVLCLPPFCSAAIDMAQVWAVVSQLLRDERCSGMMATAWQQVGDLRCALPGCRTLTEERCLGIAYGPEMRLYSTHIPW